MERGISVVLPSYKEAENLEKLLPRLNTVLSKTKLPYEILVLDTKEAFDNTKDVCKVYNANYMPRYGGDLYGDAIRTGFRAAKYSYTVVMDGDGSHNPEDIIRFLHEIDTTDLVIGSRYCKGGVTDNNFILRFMSYILNCTYRIVFGIKAKDVSDSYRMYHTEQIRSLNLECYNFDIVEEILIKLNLSKKSFTIKEVPIQFNKREFGESKRDLKKFIVSYIKTMKKLYDIKLVTKGKENSLFSRIIKFGFTGGVGTLFNLFIFFVLVDCLKVNPNIGSVAAFIVAVTHNYLANSSWTFRFQSKEKASFFQWVKYVLVNIVGLVANLGILNLLQYFWTWKLQTLPQLAGILVGMVFNFLFANFFVFKKEDIKNDIIS